MNSRGKRSRSARASNVKDKTAQSVEDILSKVIHDVADGDTETPVTLLSLLRSSCNQDEGGANVMHQPTECTTNEVDYVGHILSDAGGRHTPSPNQPLADDPSSSTWRHSLEHQDSDFQLVHNVADDGVVDEEVEDPELGSFHNHETEDPPMTQPVEATTAEPNDLRTSERNTSGGQTLVPPESQQPPAGSPSKSKASERQSDWVEDDGEPAEQDDGERAEQDDDEPAEQEDSQAGKPKSFKWSDEIEFDEMEEVEMRDREGKRGRKGGKILPRNVWSLPPGVRFVVPFNDLDQPIRKGGHVLVRFLGDVAKTGELCPIGDESWLKVDKSIKANIIAVVREKFVIPARAEVNKNLLRHVANNWRIYRYRLKVKYKTAGKTQEQVASVVPKGVVPSQWTKLVEYWFSDKSEHLSTRGKEARASQLHMHTTGSKSFAMKRDEFEKVHGREPGAVEWFAQTHQKKDGTFVEDTSKEFLDTAETMIAQRGAPSSSKERVAIENEVFNELMYSDDDQRPIGYGLGVDRKKVFGVEAELKKRKFLASGTYRASEEPECITRKKKSRVGEEEASRSGYMASDTSAEVERLNFAVAAMGETNQLMQAQLKMQSKQLKRQSRQLQMQSQQMEGLQNQLKQVTSLLTKFGAMLNKQPPVNPTPRPIPRVASRPIARGAPIPRVAPYRATNFATPQVPPTMHEFSDDESESSEWDSD